MTIIGLAGYLRVESLDVIWDLGMTT